MISSPVNDLVGFGVSHRIMDELRSTSQICPPIYILITYIPSSLNHCENQPQEIRVDVQANVVYDVAQCVY